MLKMSSKRRRTQAEIKADKLAAQQKESITQTQQVEIEQLKQQLQQLQQENATGKIASSLMSQFIDSGLVHHDEGGEFIIKANDSPSKFKP